MENGWIKVEDRLPSYGQVVIVSEYGEVYSGVQFFEPNEFVDFEGCNKYKPTHWMPLPKPPTE